LPDARLELNTYELLLRGGHDPGDWIGESISLSKGTTREPASPVALATLLGRAHRRRFRRAGRDASSGFLQLSCHAFEELGADGELVARQPLELVTPSRLSCQTIAVAPLHRASDGRVLLGIDDDDLPAAQCFEGNSELLVAPAWRLPHGVDGIARSRAWIAERMRHDYGVNCRHIWELGGRYHPSAGMTPEVVYPLAVEVEAADEGARTLHWVALDETVERRAELHDGHLSILVLRAAHALGLLAPA
jgi:hypothetical protein